MKAMILCAGLGTRMRPLTERWPKPALPLLGQPLLRYNLALLSAVGIRQIGINTHHLPEVMRACAEAECARFGMSLTVAHEPIIQGTGGGIRGLRGLLESDDFLVLNGDILFAIALAPVIAAHRSSGAAATMVLLPMPEGERYAAVEMDADLRVRRIAGHGPGGAGLSRWHFSGVHVMSPLVFGFMSPQGEEDINRGVYVKMIEAGLLVRGHVAEGAWRDLGTASRYLAAQVDVLSGRVPLDVFSGAAPVGERIAPSALVDPTAKLGEGAWVGEGVYVGAGVRIEEAARLTRCAVLEGTIVAPGEVVTDAIAWGAHRIPAGERSPSVRA